METTGKLINMTMDISSGKLNVTFQIDTKPLDDLNSLEKMESLDIIAKKHRKKRSLDANAYFHLLVGKMADTISPPISKTRCKNMLIGRYGQPELLDDGTPVIIKTNIDVDKMLEQEFLHCLPCRVENDVVFYRVCRGSHTYDSKEMSILIDGTVQEAKMLGIETIHPDQIQRMVTMWKGEK